MAQQYQRVVQEDLNVGTSAVWVKAPGGGELYSTQVGLHSFARGQKEYTATWAPGSIAAGLSASTTVTVPDAAVADFVLACHDKMLTSELRISGHVSAANTATVVIHNPTSAAVTVASGTVSVLVFPVIAIVPGADVANVTGTVYYDGTELWANGVDIVTMTLDGSPYGTASTDANGVYTFVGVPAGEVGVVADGNPGPGPRNGLNSGTHVPPTPTTLDIYAVGS